MATGPIYNAISDIEIIGQKPTLERIQLVSGQSMAEVVTCLKVNKAVLALNSDKIRLTSASSTNWTE